MRVADHGLHAEGHADCVLERGPVTVWASGWTPAGLEALCETWLERGADAVVGWPGAWSAVAKRAYVPGLEVRVAPYGEGVYTDGRVVAGDVAALPDLAGRPVDPGGMGQWLSGRIADPLATPLVGVSRIAGGFGGHVGTPSVIARRWVPRPEARERSVAALRGLVEQIVRERASPGGAHHVALSGGLDSSIVSGVLTGHGDVVGVSNRFAGRADEGPFIRAVGEHQGLSLEDVPSSDLDPLEVLDLLAPPRFPPILVNHHLNLALLRAARGPLWTGFGGDEVFGHGFDRVRELAEQGRGLRAAWEAAWLAARYRHQRVGAVRAVRTWGSRLVRAALPDRARRAPPGRPRGVAQRRLETVTHPLLGLSLHEQHQIARAVGASVVMPLLDPRLVELCLAIPASRLVRRGRTRWIVREAFADLLPDRVRLRPDKADLSEALDGPLRRADLGLREELLAPWISRVALDGLRAAWQAGSHDAAASLFRMAGASRWLSWHASARGSSA